ncbi:MAG: zinc ribbon domain-containing protein [Candidatus Hermodarchaeota archaeon]
MKEEQKPVALISLDLGANKDATAVLLTSDQQPAKTKKPPKLTKEDIRFYVQPKKKELINKLDNQIASLQRRRDLYKQLSEERPFHDYQKLIKNVHRRLKSLRTKRGRIAHQLDHELVNRLLAWVKQLEEKYTVYIVVGRLKGIRNNQSFRKGQRTSRYVRRELHQWAYARITELIQYKLYRIGLPANRLRKVSEAYTSQTCHKGGSRNTRRPFQSLLICADCGANLQADINGAMNIALRLIVSMLEINALDQWLTNPLMTRKLELLAKRKRRALGRKNATKNQQKQHQTTLPMISRPKSGIETPPL